MGRSRTKISHRSPLGSGRETSYNVKTDDNDPDDYVGVLATLKGSKFGGCDQVLKMAWSGV